MSLFSVFDPVGVLGVSFSWMFMLFVFLFVPVKYWVFVGWVGEVWDSVMASMSKILVEISYPYSFGLVSISMVLLICVALENSSGLFPYVFTCTSHVLVTLSMGLVFWFSFFLMGWGMEFSKSSSHLVPDGAPMILSPMMVIIESVSHLIRPVTLSIRLAANMMAGHLIIGLIGSLSEVSFLSGVVSVFLQGMMLVLEGAVVFIQAFVFSVLVMLYALDYY